MTALHNNLRSRMDAMMKKHSMNNSDQGEQVKTTNTVTAPVVEQVEVSTLPAANGAVMNSLDLLDHINTFRIEEGKTKQTHSNFMKKIRDELDEAVVDFEGSYKGKDNAKTNCYFLPKDECMRMALRESKHVRKNMVKKLNDLLVDHNNQQQGQVAPVQALPNFSNPIEAARAWADELEQKQLAHVQLQEQAPKVEYCDKVLTSEGGLRTTEIATEFGLSAIALNAILKNQRVQRKVGGRWVLTVAFSGQGYSEESTFIDIKGRSHHSLLWTEKGRSLIHELINA